MAKQHPSRKAGREGQGQSSAWGSLFLQLRGPLLLSTFLCILTLKIPCPQLLPRPSTETIFQRNHLAVKKNEFSVLLRAIYQGIILLYPALFYLCASLLGKPVCSDCRYIMFLTCLKEHFCLLPFLSALSTPLLVNRATNSQTHGSDFDHFTNT